MDLSEWFYVAANRSLEDKRKATRIQSDREQKRSRHEEILALLAENELDSRYEISWIVKQLERFPFEGIVAEFLGQWEEYQKILHIHNREFANGMESQEPNYFQRFVAKLTFDRLFKNNKLWDNVPTQSYYQQKLDLLTQEKPLSITSKKRKFEPEQESKSFSFTLDQAKTFMRVLSNRAQLQAWRTEMAWWLTHNLEPDIQKCLELFDKARDATMTRVEDDMKLIDPKANLAELKSETTEEWKRELVLDWSDDDLKEAIRDNLHSADQRLAFHADLFQSKKRMEFLVKYESYLLAKTIRHGLEGTSAATLTSIESLETLQNSPVELTITLREVSAFAPKNKREKTTRLNESDEIAGALLNLRRFHEDLRLALADVDKATMDVKELHDQREAARTSAVNMDYAHWLKSVLGNSKLLEAFEAKATDTTNIDRLLGLEQEALVRAERECQRQREVAIKRITEVSQILRKLNLAYARIKSRLDGQYERTTSEMFSISRPWETLSVSEQDKEALRKEFGDTKVETKGMSQTGQEYVDNLQRFVRNKTELVSETFQDMIPRLTELMIAWYTIDMTKSEI